MKIKQFRHNLMVTNYMYKYSRKMQQNQGALYITFSLILHIDISEFLDTICESLVKI